MNIERLLDYLSLNREEFSFQFQSHPNYPSALAFSDTLSFLGVKNEVYELEKEFWNELPDEFITIANDKFSLLKKDKENYKVFSEDEKIFSKEELHKSSLNIVMLFEKIEASKTTSPKNTQAYIYLLLGCILLFSLFNNSFSGFIFNSFSIVGIFISLELFKKKIGQESVALNTVCGGNLNSSSSNSCSKIINSDNINIFGLKFSDFSLIYFIWILVLGMFFPSTEFVIQILSFISPLVIFYSLYVQIVVEKTICKICLIIILVLILQIFVSYFYFQFIFSIPFLLLSLLSFVVLLLGFVFINDLLFKNENLKKINIKNVRFKRNYDVFKRELLLEEKIFFKDNYCGFFFGNPQSKLHISLVSNPFCGFCKEAHQIMESVFTKYPENISFQVRFNYFSETGNADLTELMKSLTKIYQKNPQEFLSALHFWFEEKDLTQFKERYKCDYGDEDLTTTTDIANDNFINNLTFTPIFLINGYKFPDRYDREDLFYFFDELLEDEQIAI